jgi:hypothetical protein
VWPDSYRHRPEFLEPWRSKQQFSKFCSASLSAAHDRSPPNDKQVRRAKLQGARIHSGPSEPVEYGGIEYGEGYLCPYGLRVRLPLEAKTIFEVLISVLILVREGDQFR